MRSHQKSRVLLIYRRNAHRWMGKRRNARRRNDVTELSHSAGNTPEIK